jgi:inositol 3-alpha-galactosyltransferase
MASPKHAYATLLTRPTYLAGAVLLAHSLHTHSPSTPIIICYTPATLGEESISALQKESTHSNIVLRAVSPLLVPEDEAKHPGTGAEKGGRDEGTGMVAARFMDTWTKLRVFELGDLGYDLICFLDADMLIFADPSPLVFSPSVVSYLAGELNGESDGRAERKPRVAASHVCVCNLDGDKWAPAEWKKENCAFARLGQRLREEPRSACSDEAAREGDRRDAPEAVAGHPTLGIFNSGTVVFAPSAALHEHVLGAFGNTSGHVLRGMKFPDQDFLNMVFDGRWTSLPWSCNALKTWRYWHPDIWEDGEVRVLHYIVDKPWAKRVVMEEEEGGQVGEKKPVAGYKGLDGETHSWWWAEYEKWHALRKGQGENELLKVVDRYVASEDGVDNEAFKDVGGGAQDFAKRWVKGNEEGKVGKEKDGTYGQGSHGPILRKPMLGERGHGPVVRN